jgi:hypothetical protein
MRFQSLADLAIGLMLYPAAASALELRVRSSWNESYRSRPKLLLNNSADDLLGRKIRGTRKAKGLY